MTVLHYLFGLPPVHKGGVPSYVLDLVHMQRNLGHCAYLLMPGKMNKGSREVDIVPVRRGREKCFEVVNSSYIANEYGVAEPDGFMRAAPLLKYKRLLKELQVQVMHLHSMLGLQKELLLAAKELKIPIIYTSHDYYGLCPKIDLLRQGKPCMVRDWGSCNECCRHAYGLDKLRFRQSALYRWYCHMPLLMKVVHSEPAGWVRKLMYRFPVSGKTSSADSRDEQGSKVQGFLKLQQYYQEIFDLIDYYHFNSLQSKEIYETHLGTLPGEVLSITKAGITDSREKLLPASKLRIGYLGTSDLKKGYPYLLKQLDMLYAGGRTNFQLNTYLVDETEKRPYQKNHVPFSGGQQEKVYRSMDLLVVPSVWKETFGLVVLEALSYGVPVLLSEHVGAKQLLYEHRGTGGVFPLENNGLLKVLKEIYDDRSILAGMSEAICSSDMNFDFKRHVLDVLGIYAKCFRCYGNGAYQ